jgi:hypothetical protein
MPKKKKHSTALQLVTPPQLTERRIYTGPVATTQSMPETRLV